MIQYSRFNTIPEGDYVLSYSTKTSLYTSLMFIVFVVFILFSGEVFAFKQSVSVYCQGERVDFSGIEPVIYNGKVMTPMRKTFEIIGAQVKFDETTNIMTGKMNGNTVVLQTDNNTMTINNNVIQINVSPMYFGNNLMVPLRTIAQAFMCDVIWYPQSMSVHVSKADNPNSMLGTELTDEYRYDFYCGNYKGFDIFKENDDSIDDYFCMELVNISDEQCIRYAKLVNAFADTVPDAMTYSIVVPTASEFYANNQYKTNHLDAINKIYSNLDEKIIGVNIEKTLMEHADEYIFFKTDHHWTQLGAYYAYQEFLDYSLDEIDPAENFVRESIADFQGSFLEYTYNTPGYDLLINTYDELDLYYPAVSSEGTLYHDVNMAEYINDSLAINPNFKNYDCFMEGDYPVEVFKTGNRNGKKLCIVKESFGNAFAVWALNNYEEVYVIDFRRFNNYIGDPESFREFKISNFYDNVKFDDLIIISYPVTISGESEMTALEAMAK